MTQAVIQYTILQPTATQNTPMEQVLVMQEIIHISMLYIEIKIVIIELSERGMIILHQILQAMVI